MVKRTSSILLVAVILMGVLFTLPVSASEETSWDMEVWEQEEGKTDAPAGFEITLGEGATAVRSGEEEEIFGNRTNKIKIVHSQNTTTTISVNSGLDGEANVNAEYSVYFVLKELAEGSEGVKLEIGDKYVNYSTNFFVDDSYEKWRKMMCAYPGSAYNMNLTVTFSGQGTLYLDNAAAKKTGPILNGDFEGLVGDGKLFGTVTGNVGGPIGTLSLWPSSVINVKPSEAVEPSSQTMYFVERNDNNYLVLVNPTSRGEGFVCHTSNTKALTEGKAYRILVNNKTTNGVGMGVYINGAAQMPSSPMSCPGLYVGPTSDWSVKSFDFVYGYGVASVQTQMQMNLYGYQHSSDAQEATMVYYDDFRIEEITEEAKLVDVETGERIYQLPRGKKVELRFEKPLLDTAVDGFDTMKLSGAETNEKITMIAVLYEKKENVKTIKEIEIAEKGGRTELGANWSFGEGTPMEVGFLPAQGSFVWEIPDEGDYEVRLMGWKSISGMESAIENVYTYVTEAAEEGAKA